MTPLTIGFPVYNESRLIREFLQALDQIASQLPAYDIDLLVVNDGSSDKTLEYLRKTPLATIQRIRVVTLSRNFGQPQALRCLISLLSSSWSIILDSDFQDDPALIPVLLQKQQDTGADVVRVARSTHNEQGLSRLGFYIFRKLFKRLTGSKDSFGTFGLYSKQAVDFLQQFQEVHYYFPGLVSSMGLKTEVLRVPRQARRDGTSTVGIRRLVQLGFDAFFSFSALPIRLASLFGIVIIAMGFAGILVVVYLRLFTTSAIPGWASILSVVTFFGGVQLLFLGILGEYTARIFEQVKQRPPYLIQSIEQLTPHKREPAAR